MSASTLIPAVRRAAFWPALIGLLIGIACLGVIFRSECSAALRTWEDSTAYGHCFLVGPIAAYLAWERRERLRGLLLQPTALFLPLAIPGVLAWFAAERLGFMEGRQLAVLGFLELLVLSVLGWPVTRVLLAPLAYLVFLVPFGAFITPVLQGFTAHFIDVGLTLLGISHYADDMIIEISAGTFFVAEACAGLRFLIAAVAFGVFYALLNYRSPGRRLFFIGLSVAVPIVANGFRALGIVLLGHVLGSAEAAAADHLIYGWVFFSVVMLFLVVIGLPLREAPMAANEASPPPAMVRGRMHPSWVVVSLLLLAVAGPATAAVLDRSRMPPVLRGSAVFAAPSSCAVEPGEHDDAVARFAVQCAARRWMVTMQAVPARSTGAAIGEVRSRLVGHVGAEDATTAPLRGTPAEAGNWQLTVAREPPLVAAISTWVHGAPASGGLRQRLIQAGDSVLGNDTPPLLIAIVVRPTSAMGEAELEAARSELRAILAAQPDLAGQVARLTGAR